MLKTDKALSAWFSHVVMDIWARTVDKIGTSKKFTGYILHWVTVHNVSTGIVQSLHKLQDVKLDESKTSFLSKLFNLVYRNLKYTSIC